MDECGQGDAAANLRRIERLAQVRGDCSGTTSRAERLRARVLEARERSSRAHGDHEPGKRGFVRDGDVAAKSRVAAAHEQRARSLEALGRRSDAIDALRSAVRIHEARLSDAMGLGIPRELLDADDIRPSGLVRGVSSTSRTEVNPMFGGRGPGAAAEAAAANMRLQLASARLALADVALREEEPRGDEAMEAMATEQLARAVGSLQPLAAARPPRPSPPPARTTRDRRGPRVARTGTTGTGPPPRPSAGARVSEAPERHVAALILFARAARTLAAAESARQATQRGDRRRGASPRRCGGVAVRVVRRGRERRGGGGSGQGAAEGAARVRRVRRGVEAMTAAGAAFF